MRHAVGSADDIPAGEVRAFRVADREILIYHLSDGFFATQSRCTHLFRSLKGGRVIEDRCIQCPLHRARFDIRTGEVEAWASFPPGVQLLNAVRREKSLQTWPVRVEEGQLVVELE